MSLDPEFLAILACPLCKAPLKEEGDFLISALGLKYRIEDGIPILLLDEAILPEGFSSLTELEERFKNSPESFTLS